MGRSDAELLLATQLDQAGIYHVREFNFHPSRKWKADFMLSLDLLVEVEGGVYVAGRHTRGPAFEKDCEKYAAAAILGYRVIRCTPRQVNDGTALEWIRAALTLNERSAA